MIPNKVIRECLLVVVESENKNMMTEKKLVFSPIPALIVPISHSLDIV